MEKRRFTFLDVVTVKNCNDFPQNTALVIQSNISAFGETLQLQWMDGKPDTIMHGSQLETNGSYGRRHAR